MTPKKFRYQPLDPTQPVFRLLVLKKGTGPKLEGHLVVSALEDRKNRYEAVSYTWGNNVGVDIISLHGRHLNLSLNLSLILRDLRDPYEDRILWVDAICIDQGNISERGHQVQQMRDIYRNSKRVLFCISRQTEMTDILLTSLQELQNHDITKSASFDLDDWSMAWSEIQSRYRGEYSGLEGKQRDGLLHILAQPWFNRVWILQEVANARDGLVYCGKKCISAGVFAVHVKLLDWSTISSHCQSVLNLMPGPSRNYSLNGRDLYSLLRKFPRAEATDERDKVYALLGIHSDTQRRELLEVDYHKSSQEVIQATVAYICCCDIKSIPQRQEFFTFDSWLPVLDNMINLVLEYCLADLSDVENAFSILTHRSEHIRVTPKMLVSAASDEMQEKKIMDLLLGCVNASTDLDVTSSRKALYWAAANGHFGAVQKLSRIAMVDDTAYTSLVLFYCQGPTDYEFQKAWSNDDTAWYDGESPLMLAIGGGHKAIVRWLLENGANPNVQFKRYDGETPLGLAIRGKNKAIIQLLLQHGADPNFEYKQEARGFFSSSSEEISGRTPMDVARADGNDVVIRLLVAWGEEGGGGEVDC